MKLTSPRPMVVVDPKADLDQLFGELVGGTVEKSKKATRLVVLDNVFHRLAREGRARLDVKIDVPVIHRPLLVPYAYRNGTLNFVMPHQFSRHQGHAIDSAVKLAVDGDLIRRHPFDGGLQNKLIVIPSFSGEDPELKSRVDELFSNYQVDVVPESEVSSFAERVAKEAHS